ncbi:PH domain-containing protein [Gulosibacter bifidus]|uniref:PH domain-containing protein n=1 Tax=Gulosibacter bifidus TaxID=272239 RepID=A0ABW5RK31_9MICO|nr:PH domain-containing protein [Gulosibacter bifidus]
MPQHPAPQIQWRSISSKLAFREVASMLLGAVCWGVVAVVLLATTSAYGPYWLIGAVPAVLTLCFVPMAFARVRSIGYALRQDDLLTRRGIMYRQQKAVPYGRLQHIDVKQSAFDRMLGIYTLHVVTAASSVAIPGLTKAESEGLRDHLIAVAETRRAGL